MKRLAPLLPLLALAACGSDVSTAPPDDAGPSSSPATTATTGPRATTSSGDTTTDGSGGDAGTGGNAGTGGSAGGAPECTPGTSSCDGLTLLTCSAAGTWEETVDCPFVCADGTCSGECIPDVRRCQADDVERCDDTGSWTFDAACPFVCDDGACVDECAPGDTSCSGNTLRTCTEDGVFVDGETCEFVCDDGACTGVCTPGEKRCDGGAPELCDALGQWASGEACPFYCDGGECAGECEPGDETCVDADHAQCGDDYVWHHESCEGWAGGDTHFECEGDQCVQVCDPGRLECGGGGDFNCESWYLSTTSCLACGVVCTGTSPYPNVGAVCTEEGCGLGCQGDWHECDGVVENGCEAHPNDPVNCGACDSRCWGWECSSGRCQRRGGSGDVGLDPIEPVAQVDGVTSLSAGGPFGRDELYLTLEDGRVAKVPAAGGDLETLADDEPSPRAAATDGDRVFWVNGATNSESIRGVGVDGGAAQTLAAGMAPLRLTVDGGALLFTDGASLDPCFCSDSSETDIYRLSLGGGAPTVVNSSPGAASRAFSSWPGLVVADAKLHRIRWVDALATSDVAHVDLPGGTNAGITSPPIPGQEIFAARHLLVTPSGMIYFVATGAGGLDSAYRYDSHAPSAVPEAFATVGLGQITGMVGDDWGVYCSIRGTDYDEIRWFSDAFSPFLSTQIMADRQVAVGPMVLDDTHLYWAAEGSLDEDGLPLDPPAVLRIRRYEQWTD